jgi:hypothetical protein
MNKTANIQKPPQTDVDSSNGHHHHKEWRVQLSNISQGVSQPTESQLINIKGDRY